MARFNDTKIRFSFSLSDIDDEPFHMTIGTISNSMRTSMFLTMEEAEQLHFQIETAIRELTEESEDEGHIREGDEATG